MKDLHYFISDVTSFPVTFAEQDDGLQLVEGLPIMQPGEYHGKTYTAEDLQQIAENFDTIRDRDGFTPSLTPKHWADVDEALGPITALRFDEERVGLVADAIVTEETVGKIKSKAYRYISGEIDFDYKLQTDEQEHIGPALEGAAFVLSPAVRGMQIDAALNAHEFPQLFEQPLCENHIELSVAMNRMNANITQLLENLRKERKGGDKKMTVLDKWKAFVERLRKGEEVTDEEVTALAAEAEPKAGDADGIQKTGKTVELGKDDDKPTLDTDQISRQMRQLEKSNEEQGEEIAQLRQLRLRDQCDAQVDELVRGGHVPPAQRQQVYLMLEKLSADQDTKLIVLGKDAEGEKTTSEQTPLEVYINTLKGMGLAEKTPETLSGGFFDEEVLDEASEAAAVAMGERMVAAIPPDQRKETEKTD